MDSKAYFLRTFNDSLDQPIWAVNEKTGFRRTVEWSSCERLFRTETAAALRLSEARANGPGPRRFRSRGHSKTL